MNISKTALSKLLVLLLLLVIGWNYWLPAANDYFNHVSPANENRPADLKNIDFHAYYDAGMRFNGGRDPYVYGNDPQGIPVLTDYIYPPTFLPFFSLLARLPYEVARVAWLGLYALSYLGVLAWLFFSFRHTGRMTFLALALILTLASFPLLDHILTGQADILVICLILGSYLAYASGRRLLSAVLLAAATLLKVSPVFLLFYYLIFQRDGRFLVFYLCTCLVLAGLSLLFVPFGLYPEYVLHILPGVSAGTSNYLNQSLLRYLSFSPWIARLVSFGGLALLAVLIWLVSRRYTPAERLPALPLGENHFTAETAFLLNLTAILIFVGKAWPATYVWLILPAAWLMAGLIDRPTRLGAWGAIVLAGFLVLAKNYGYPVLESLNLWGNLLLSTWLSLGLLKPGSLFSARVQSDPGAPRTP